MATILPPQQELPRYARAGDGEYYTWDGAEFPRVTSILAIAPGEHLMPWYGKMAALRAASHLVAAGVEFDDAALAEFAQTQDDPPRTLDEAYGRILDWATNMKEPERYRDFKGRIGSLCHHGLYETVMGRRPEGDMIAYLMSSAYKLCLLDGKDGEKPTDRPLQALAFDARPYLMSALDWLDEVKPEFEMIGAEACVVSESYDYAGTMDGIATIDALKDRALTKLFGNRKVRVLLDFKTSKSVSTSFQFQLEAYRNADFIGLFPDGSRHELGEFDGLMILHIRPGELCRVVAYEPSDDIFRGFLGLRDYYGAIRNKPRRNRREIAPKPAPMRTSARPAPFGGRS